MIEAVCEKNIDELLPLIRQYQEFYKCQNICDVKNLVHFNQFGPESEKGCQFLYRLDGLSVAFATIYFTYSSSLPGKIGLMNDLYTTVEHRRKGIGTALIKHCFEYAKAHGAHRIQWLTADDNHNAQRLYDSVTENKSRWIFYSYSGQ